jgi:hypothetical protein
MSQTSCALSREDPQTGVRQFGPALPIACHEKRLAQARQLS